MRLIKLSNAVNATIPVYNEAPDIKMPTEERLPCNSHEANIDKTVNLILKSQNNVYNYSIKQAAEILNLSPEFIRRRITVGTINSVKFGDKPMISIFELAKLLIGGIN